jgi:hypothetical protein
MALGEYLPFYNVDNEKIFLRMVEKNVAAFLFK